MTIPLVPKRSPKQFQCEQCDYTTFKESQYKRHLLTPKHTRLQNTANTAFNVPKFTCECGKQYAHRQSLYNHSKKCTVTSSHKNTIISNDENHQLQEENSELKTMLQTIIQHTHEKETRAEHINQEFQTQWWQQVRHLVQPVLVPKEPKLWRSPQRERSSLWNPP